MTALYQLTELYAELLDRYQTCEDQNELDSIASELQAVDGLWEDKASNVVKMIRQLQADAEMFDTEMTTMKTKRDRARNGADRLKRYLEIEMLGLNRDKVDLGLFKIRLQNNPPSCSVTDPTALPAEFRRVIPQVIEADKRAIIEAWKMTGDTPEGVEITVSRSLRIA